MAVITPSQAKKYFDYPDYSNWFYGTLVVGLIACFVEFWVGAVILLISAAIFYFCLMNVPTDQDIEDTYENFVLSKIPDALKDTNLTEDDLIRDPDWFWYLSGEIQDHPKRYRYGEDRITRANTRAFQIILYAANQVLTYEFDYNIEDHVKTYSNNSEWFYKDVVAVEVNLSGESKFILRTSGGQKEIPLSRIEDNEQADIAKAQAVMNALRTMLREKKLA